MNSSNINTANSSASKLNKKITFRYLILKDSDQSKTSTIIWIVIHIIVWPVAALFTGGFFVFVTILFFEKGRIDEKPSTVFARVETIILSIILAIIYFMNSSFLSNDFQQYGYTVSQEAFIVLSAIIFLISSFSLILLWVDYKREVKIKEILLEKYSISV